MYIKLQSSCQCWQGKEEASLLKGTSAEIRKYLFYLCLNNIPEISTDKLRYSSLQLQSVPLLCLPRFKGEGMEFGMVILDILCRS